MEQYRKVIDTVDSLTRDGLEREKEFNFRGALSSYTKALDLVLSQKFKMSRATTEAAAQRRRCPPGGSDASSSSSTTTTTTAAAAAAINREEEEFAMQAERDLQQKYIDILQRRSFVYTQVQMYDEALRDAQKAIELQPQKTSTRDLQQSYLWLVQVLRLQDRNDAALKIMEEAAKLDPSNTEFLREIDALKRQMNTHKRKREESLSTTATATATKTATTTTSSSSSGASSSNTVRIIDLTTEPNTDAADVSNNNDLSVSARPRIGYCESTAAATATTSSSSSSNNNNAEINIRPVSTLQPDHEAIDEGDEGPRSGVSRDHQELNQRPTKQRRGDSSNSSIDECGDSSGQRASSSSNDGYHADNGDSSEQARTPENNRNNNNNNNDDYGEGNGNNENNNNNDNNRRAQMAIFSDNKECPELECPLCYRIFYDPITLPCGHTFDRSCVTRSFDYSDKCPLCREQVHIIPNEYPTTVVLKNLIEKYLPEKYAVRQKEEAAEQIEREMNNVPLFLLDTVLFPGTPLSLHVFEPRYRLMMRRCMQGSKRFGLVTVTRGTTGNDYIIGQVGTIAKILDFQILPDGRSLIAAIGERRFKVLERWEKDGYAIGRVEWLDDEDEEQLLTEDQKKVAKDLAERLHNMAFRLMDLSDPRSKAELEKRAGPLPPATDMRQLSFWFSTVIPVPNRLKMQLLEETRPSVRMQQALSLLEQHQVASGANVEGAGCVVQ